MNKKDNTFQFKLPPGTYKAEISFMGVSGIHEFHFSKNTNEASHVSWEDYDYEYKSEAYMLDREWTKCGRHPPNCWKTHSQGWEHVWVLQPHQTLPFYKWIIG